MGRDFNDFTDEQANLLGTTLFWILMRTMLCIDFMHLCVAYSSPDIVHSLNCDNNNICQKSWDGEWWRGFCRHLLHPDKIFSSAATTITLENAKIKNMNNDCLCSTVAAITMSNILDFRNEIIMEAVSEILDILGRHRENKIVKPPPTDDNGNMLGNGDKIDIVDEDAK